LRSGARIREMHLLALEDLQETSLFSTLNLISLLSRPSSLPSFGATPKEEENRERGEQKKFRCAAREEERARNMREKKKGNATREE